MNLSDFQQLSQQEIHSLVQEKGPRVVVCPINGTRRWFFMEYSPSNKEDYSSKYLKVLETRTVEIYKLFFDHGVHTLLVPSFGPDLMARGTAYTELAAEALGHIAAISLYLDFYKKYQVRVGFYGDYKKEFQGTPFAFLIDKFAEVTEKTREYDRHRLFFGLFAQDATETVAEIGATFMQVHNRLPKKKEIVEVYYGENIPAVDVFIGFDRFASFDMPLLATGEEDLYFTATPTPYFDSRQLRTILHDHLFARQGSLDYEAAEEEDFTLMRAFYEANLLTIFGVGINHRGVWYPHPQINLPPDILSG